MKWYNFNTVSSWINPLVQNSIPLFLLLYISGCTTTSFIYQDEVQLKRWLDKHQYAKAYETLTYSKELNALKSLKHADKPTSTDQLNKESEEDTQLKHIADLSETYWQSVETEVKQLTKQKKWKTAKKTLNFAIRNLINSKPAEDELASVIAHETSTLYQLQVDEAIARGRWLHKEYQRQQVIKYSTQASMLTPITLQQLKSKQHTLAQQLLQYAKTALTNKKPKRAKQCYDTLTLIVTPTQLAPDIAAIEEALSQKKKDDLAIRQKSLLAAINKHIQDGQFVEATQKIEQLKKLNPLPENILIKIDAVNSVLSFNAEFLDEKADLYYRDGNVELANSIWEYLLRLNPDNTDIQLKLTRSEKVIKNMQELRDSGHKTTP
jgi:tetratricopeptide (TPR) repeat protein